MFSNWLTTTSTNAPPPDIVLEVGPPPFVRYAAHSALLSAHSGYLRSAIRPEERSYDTPIYLPNVTQDQFSPLLTYMYTGFLDLSIENIFAVLLATHVLHMPRASDICRTFLARTQSEGYLGGAFLANSVAAASDSVLEKSSGSVKIIRPIASKAAGTGLGFIAPPISTVLLPSPDTPFKSLLQQVKATAHTKRERSPVASTSKRHSPVLLPAIAPKRKSKKMPQNEIKPGPVSTPISYPPASREDKQTLLVTKKSTITVCDIAEDPIRLDGSNKTIIDIASCDGPVRFRRVLNEAYGRSGTATASNTKSMERSHHHVATSFHLQMAKTINEQRLQQQSVDEESENSQEINVLTLESNSPNEEGTPRPPPLPISSTAKASGSTDELFSCVYCKHTFKSQYCYQKHAKRHINPLSIDDTELVVETLDSGSEKDEKGSSSGGDPGSRNGSAVRREVRPLDMNVQYYPCKTCGSKFPSYYFVHKHRKLCHADVVTEENSSSV